MSLLGKIQSRGIFERILLVVDGSAAGARAAKFAIIMARQGGAELFAISVVDTATIRELELSRIFVEEEGREYERSLEEDAKNTCTTLPVWPSRRNAGLRQCSSGGQSMAGSSSLPWKSGST